jgi:hypothetical protein
MTQSVDTVMGDFGTMSFAARPFAEANNFVQFNTLTKSLKRAGGERRVTAFMWFKHTLWLSPQS